MKYLSTTFLLVFAFITGSFAQTPGAKAPTPGGPDFKFSNVTHEFGRIKEEGGPVTYIYKFVNIGDKPLKVERVQPACGCTTPDWTKTEVAPGKEGVVKATFDPMGRPGKFNKSVTVFSNSKNPVLILSFSGEVIPRVKSVEDTFPNAVGNLRFVTNHVNYGSLKNNLTDTVAYLTMMNMSKKPITITALQGPSYIFLNPKDLPFTVPVRKETKLPIHYNTSAIKDFGLQFDQIQLITNDDKDGLKPLSVIGNIHQYLPAMNTEQRMKAAHIVFDKPLFNFETIKQGDVVHTSFHFKNTGKQNLEIFKVKSTCGCTAPEPAKTHLKPDKESNINVTFYSAGKSGKEEKPITVYTNDPSAPEAVIKIMANIIVPPADKTSSH